MTALFRRARWFCVTLGGYLMVRLWQLWFAEVQIHPDTGSYRAAAGELGESLISWSGNAHRLWGVPVFFALFSGDWSRMAGQWTVSTVAWALLAWAFWRTMRTQSGRVTAVVSTLLLAAVPPVTGWDFALLSESLSISLGVAALACFLLWRQSGSGLALAAMVAIAVWWTFSRFEMALLLAVLVAAVVWHGWRHRPSAKAALVAVTVLSGTMAWAVVANTNVERHGGHPYSRGGPPSEEQAIYRLGRSVYQDSSVERVFTQRLGLPDCPGLAQQARREWHIQRIPDAYGECPELQEWVKKNAATIGLRFALAAPVEYARVTAPKWARMLYGTHTNKVAKVLPVHVTDLVFFPRVPWAYVQFPLMVLLIAAGALWTGAFRLHRRLAITAVVLIGAGLASQLAALQFAVEGLSRLGSQEAILVRIGLIMLLAATVDLLAERGRTA